MRLKTTNPSSVKIGLSSCFGAVSIGCQFMFLLHCINYFAAIGQSGAFLMAHRAAVMNPRQRRNVAPLPCVAGIAAQIGGDDAPRVSQIRAIGILPRHSGVLPICAMDLQRPKGLRLSVYIVAGNRSKPARRFDVMQCPPKRFRRCSVSRREGCEGDEQEFCFH